MNHHQSNLDNYHKSTAKDYRTDLSVKPETLLHKNVPLGFALKGIDSSHPKLRTYGIEPQIAANFGAGFFPGRGSRGGWIVFPMNDQRGRLLGYVSHATDKTRPRYTYPAGVNRDLEIFNLHRMIATRTERVIVVGDFFNAMRVAQCGFDCVIALPDHKLSQRQEDLIAKHFNHVILLFGLNRRDDEFCRHVSRRLTKRLFVRTVPLNLPEPSFNRLPATHIRSALAQALQSE